MPIVLVTGGSGALGRHIVSQLQASGYNVRIMSRQKPPVNLPSGTSWAQTDLETGQGLAGAVQDVDSIVHAASSSFKRVQQIDRSEERRVGKECRSRWWA